MVEWNEFLGLAMLLWCASSWLLLLAMFAEGHVRYTSRRARRLTYAASIVATAAVAVAFFGSGVV